MTKNRHLVEWIKLGIEVLNTIYVEARKKIKDRQGTGVFTVNSESVSRFINPEKSFADISKAKIFVVPYGKHGITKITEMSQ